MKFSNFQSIVSEARLQRYLSACEGNRSKAKTLYRYNIKVSLALFAVIGAFEIALRNAIDKAMRERFGKDWLRDAILPAGIFDVPQCRDHAKIIRSAYERLKRHNQYTHTNLLSKMEFGIWKYMFSSPQFRATERILLKIFHNKPTSSRTIQYNNAYIFNELDRINSMRNRIAHHEPICFTSASPTVSTEYIEQTYLRLTTLLNWLDIDAHAYLYGLDHIPSICKCIKNFYPDNQRGS